MDRSINLSLPFLASGQSQKHVTMNEAVAMLDMLVQLSVLSASTATPPPAPAEGDRYIVPAAASGVWAGREGTVAAWDAGSWLFLEPREGWLAWVADAGAFRLRKAAAWEPPPSDVGGFKTLGVNATADQTNRLAVRSPATLFNHEGNDHRVVINKSASADTASLLFQTGFDGKAEIGTVGSDDLRIRTRTAGVWKERIFIQAASGAVGIGTVNPAPTGGPGAVLHLHGTGSADWSTTRYTVGAGLGANDGFLVGNLAGSAYLFNYSPTPIYIGTAAMIRLTVTGSGAVGIGTQFPTCALHVDGVMRTTPRTVSALPSAASAGAGAIAYASDAAGGPSLVYSDGGSWRRVRDGTVVA